MKEGVRTGSIILYNRRTMKSEVDRVAKKKGKEKYKPDQVATLLTDLKRTGVWIAISVGVVVLLAVVVENAI